jgi:hypothetical protein
MFWNWNEYTSNQEMLYDETAYTMLNSLHHAKQLTTPC